MKQHFLINYVIQDGEHEHRGHSLYKGTREGLDRWIEKHSEKYYSYGDGMTALRRIWGEEITLFDAENLRRLGVAFYVNGKDA